jgi:hypothetical protein
LNSLLGLCAMSGLLDGEYRSQVIGTKPGQVQISRIFRPMRAGSISRRSRTWPAWRSLGGRCRSGSKAPCAKRR